VDEFACDSFVSLAGADSDVSVSAWSRTGGLGWSSRVVSGFSEWPDAGSGCDDRSDTGIDHRPVVSKQSGGGSLRRSITEWTGHVAGAHTGPRYTHSQHRHTSENGDGGVFTLDSGSSHLPVVRDRQCDLVQPSPLLPAHVPPGGPEVRNQPFSAMSTNTEDHSPVHDDPRRRPLLLGMMILTALGVIGMRVVYMQGVVADRYLTPWAEVIVEEEVIPCRDGRILSRDGVVLAQDESRYDIAMDYRWLQSPPHPRWLRQQVSLQLSPSARRDPAQRAAAERKILQQRTDLLKNLSEVTGQSERQLTTRLAAIQKRIEKMLAAVERKRLTRMAEKQQAHVDWSEGFTGIWKIVVQELTTAPDRFAEDPIILKEELQDHVVLSNVTLNVAAAIQSQPAQFPGVHIRAMSRRSYPLEDVAAHVIGVRKTPSGVANTPQAATRSGESGIERFYSSRIAGTPGLIQHHRNRRGELVDSQQFRDPVDGEDVILTIDSRLQQIAEQLLDEKLRESSSEDPALSPQGATLVAMDIWTGDVLALACSPRPSLMTLLQPSHAEWEQLQSDSRHPLFQRTTHMAVAPGALFKVVTAAAALQTGFTQADEKIDCRGYLDEPDQYRCQIYRQHGIGHGGITVEDALSLACNVYFYEMARRMGPETLCDWAERFGLGERTGIDLPGESSGHLPQPNPGGTNPDGARWFPGSTLQLSVGQGALLVTPLQMARMFAAIANGGFLVQPRVTLPNRDHDTVAEPQKIPGLSAETLSVLQHGLERVVQDPDGNGRAARIEWMTMAGQTGTAEVKNKPAHAWFAGYAPARQPRVAFAVVLEHGGNGSASAEVARDFVTELLGYGYLRPYLSETH